MDLEQWGLAAILGAVQGISEFLPISSSAHLIIFSWGFSGKALPLSLNVAMHVGTLAALLVFFLKDWLAIARCGYLRVAAGERSFQADVLLPSLVLASIPAAVVGVLGKHSIEAYFHNPLMVIVPLVVGGFLLWYVDAVSQPQGGLERLSIRRAWGIGLAQVLALIPGVSRSGITITAGRYLGFDRDGAARFSFLLGTPAMVGAALLEGGEILEHIHEPIFYGGILVSALVGCLAISFFLGFIRRYGFLAFALYRTILAVGIALLQL